MASEKTTQILDLIKTLTVLWIGHDDEFACIRTCVRHCLCSENLLLLVEVEVDKTGRTV